MTYLNKSNKTEQLFLLTGSQVEYKNPKTIILWLYRQIIYLHQLPMHFLYYVTILSYNSLWAEI